MKHMRKLTLVCVLMLLSGCANLQAVKDYSSSSRETIQAVNPVAKDFYDSCLRANSAKPFGSLSKCATEQQASKAILTVASVLDAYDAALGALASDELADYSADVGKLTDQAKKLNGLDPKQVNAVGELASLIARAATSGYQQKEVAKFVQESDDAVGVVAEGLAYAIETNYAQAISLEISGWEDAYRRVERVDRESEPLEWEAYARLQWQRRAELDGKLATAQALAQSIRAIGQTHHRLKQDAGKLDAKEVYASVRTFIDAARPVVKDVRDAFSNK